MRRMFRLVTGRVMMTDIVLQQKLVVSVPKTRKRVCLLPSHTGVVSILSTVVHDGKCCMSWTRPGLLFK